MSKYPGIYFIHDVDAVAGQPCTYIGSTSDATKRFNSHATKLNNNKHHNKALQEAYDAGHRLQIEYIPTAKEVDVRAIEQTLLNENISSGILFNQSADATAPNRNMHLSEETKNKLRVKRKQWFEENEFSLEARQHMSEASKNRVITDDFRTKISEARTGQLHDEKSKKLMSLNRSRKVSIDGEIYHGIKEACSAVGVASACMSRRLSSDDPKWSNWIRLEPTAQKEK